MKTPCKILWTEGVTLRPQHFQQQDRYHEARLHGLATALHPYAWGVRDAVWNEAALAGNQLRAERLSLVFQDGETYDAPGADLLPDAIDLAELPAAEDAFTFFAALPALRHHGGNLADFGERFRGQNRGQDHGQDRAHARYRQLEQETPDLYTDALDAGIAVLAKQATLLPPFASRAGYVAFPVVHLRRQADGGFAIDPAFVAPSLSCEASPALVRQLDALMHKLQAKIDALHAVQREPGKDVVVQGGDASSFWLLQTISAGAASLHHHARCPGLHPERLFQDLLGLAGGLMVFSRRFAIADLPGYDHEQPGMAFARLDAILRDLVDQVISAKHVAIPLRQDAARPSYYEGSLPRDAIGPKDLLCLAVRADLPALELVATVPARFKLGAPDDVGRLVASALPGVGLVHMPQVPAAVPVRPNTYYFALQDKSPLYAKMLEGTAVSVYVPSGLKDLALELFALPS